MKTKNQTQIVCNWNVHKIVITVRAIIDDVSNVCYAIAHWTQPCTAMDRIKMFIVEARDKLHCICVFSTSLSMCLSVCLIVKCDFIFHPFEWYQLMPFCHSFCFSMYFFPFSALFRHMNEMILICWFVKCFILFCCLLYFSSSLCCFFVPQSTIKFQIE